MLQDRCWCKHMRAIHMSHGCVGADCKCRSFNQERPVADPLLRIEISPSTKDNGSSVGCHWVDGIPLSQDTDAKTWDTSDLVFRKVYYGGVLSLLQELCPIPKNGWDVKIYGDMWAVKKVMDDAEKDCQSEKDNNHDT